MRYKTSTARITAGGLAASFWKPSALQVDWSIFMWKISVISPPLFLIKVLVNEFGSASIIFALKFCQVKKWILFSIVFYKFLSREKRVNFIRKVVKIKEKFKKEEIETIARLARL